MEVLRVAINLNFFYFILGLLASFWGYFKVKKPKKKVLQVFSSV